MTTGTKVGELEEPPVVADSSRETPSIEEDAGLCDPICDEKSSFDFSNVLFFMLDFLFLLLLLFVFLVSAETESFDLEKSVVDIYYVH